MVSLDEDMKRMVEDIENTPPDGQLAAPTGAPPQAAHDQPPATLPMRALEPAVAEPGAAAPTRKRSQPDKAAELVRIAGDIQARAAALPAAVPLTAGAAADDDDDPLPPFADASPAKAAGSKRPAASKPSTAKRAKAAPAKAAPAKAAPAKAAPAVESGDEESDDEESDDEESDDEEVRCSHRAASTPIASNRAARTSPTPRPPRSCAG